MVSNERLLYGESRQLPLLVLTMRFTMERRFERGQVSI